MIRQKLSDLFAASVPTVAGLTLSQVHTLVGICGSLLGAAYLARKWWREEQAAKVSKPQ